MDAADVITLSANDLHRMRLERSLLLAEKSFLERELGTCAGLSERVMTARRSDTASEHQLLKTYLTAIHLGDKKAGAIITAEVRNQVADAQRKAKCLEELLQSVHNDVQKVLARCDGTS